MVCLDIGIFFSLKKSSVIFANALGGENRNLSNQRVWAGRTLRLAKESGLQDEKTFLERLSRKKLSQQSQLEYKNLLIESKELREISSEKGLEHIRNKYSHDKFITQWDNIFESFIIFSLWRSCLISSIPTLFSISDFVSLM